MAKILPYLAMFFGLTTAINTYAADPAQVRAIAEHVKKYGTPAEYGEGKSPGRFKEFKVPGGSGGKPFDVKVWVVAIGGLEFLIEGTDFITLDNTPIPPDEPTLSLHLVEKSPYDGKLDGALLVTRSSDGRASYQQAPTTFLQTYEKAHDAEIKAIFQRIQPK